MKCIVVALVLLAAHLGNLEGIPEADTAVVQPDGKVRLECRHPAKEIPVGTPIAKFPSDRSMIYMRQMSAESRAWRDMVKWKMFLGPYYVDPTSVPACSFISYFNENPLWIHPDFQNR